MSRLVYSREEILANHAFAKPHVEAGYRLHGGFDADGTYISPRTLNRWPAIRAWSEALKARGHELVDASQALNCCAARFPTVAQQSLLLDAGLGQTLWNSLSITGVIEARGRMPWRKPRRPISSASSATTSPTPQRAISTRACCARMASTKAATLRRARAGMTQCGSRCATCCSASTLIPHAEVPESLARPELGRLMPQIPAEL